MCVCVCVCVCLMFRPAVVGSLRGPLGRGVCVSEGDLLLPSCSSEL